MCATWSCMPACSPSRRTGLSPRTTWSRLYAGSTASKVPSAPCATDPSAEPRPWAVPETAALLERRPAPASAPPSSMAPPVRTAVAQAGGGRALPGAMGHVLNRGLGVDVSTLRVHTGTRAATAAAHLGVRAFTWGRDIFLGHGE